MGGAPKQVKADPKELKKAEELWANFMQLSKWSTIATCVILLILGLVFIDWA